MTYAHELIFHSHQVTASSCCLCCLLCSRTGVAVDDHFGIYYQEEEGAAADVVGITKILYISTMTVVKKMMIQRVMTVTITAGTTIARIEARAAAVATKKKNRKTRITITTTPAPTLGPMMITRMATHKTMSRVATIVIMVKAKEDPTDTARDQKDTAREAKEARAWEAAWAVGKDTALEAKAVRGAKAARGAKVAREAKAEKEGKYKDGRLECGVALRTAGLIPI